MAILIQVDPWTLRELARLARPSGETGTREADSDDSRRVNECRALAGYLALKTIELLGQFDPVLSHPKLGQIEALWSATYRELANLSA